MGSARALDGEGTAPTDRAAGTTGDLPAVSYAGGLPGAAMAGTWGAGQEVVGQTAEEVAALSVVGYFGVAAIAALLVVWFWFRT